MTVRVYRSSVSAGCGQCTYLSLLAPFVPPSPTTPPLATPYIFFPPLTLPPFHPFTLTPSHPHPACDCGFDPLGIAKSQTELFALREAEIKHARLAMLAAVGWPASELTHYTVAKLLGMDDLLATNERAPSVLNG